MSKTTSFSLGFTLAAIIGGFVIARERSEIHELLAEPSQASQQRQELPQEAQSPPAEAQPSETQNKDPSLEVLRLRGEISRLSRDLQQASTEKERARFALAHRQWSVRDLYWVTGTGIDTNYIPQIGFGTPRTRVMDELKRLGANIRAEEPSFVYAELQLPTVTNAVSEHLTIYFDNGNVSQVSNSQTLPDR